MALLLTLGCGCGFWGEISGMKEMPLGHERTLCLAEQKELEPGAGNRNLLGYESRMLRALFRYGSNSSTYGQPKAL